MTKDIRSKEIDEGTNITLELFKLYLRNWLTVFVKQEVNSIEIHDFFAGKGTDAVGNPGSPLLLITQLTSYCADFLTKNIRVTNLRGV